jgi:predicted  nucleic acid-binding Zn-ribbon protein
MKKSIFAALMMAICSTTAFAQQQPDQAAAMQKAIAVLQAQRNLAMDEAATALTRAALLDDELGKSKSRISELEKQLEASAPKEGK